MAAASPREITVLYFAAAWTATGLTSERVPLPARDRTHAADAPAPSTADAAPPLPRSTADSSGGRAGFPLTALAALLCARHPGVGLEEVLAGSRWAVDEEMVDEPGAVLLQGGEEVAVICPVSGG